MKNSAGTGYTGQVAFGKFGEVTLTGESLSQMEKENGKYFYSDDFGHLYPSGWMIVSRKKMAADVPLHENRESLQAAAGY